MYFTLKSWVQERGGKLMYLGGNGMNCLVEFVDPYTVIYQNGDGHELKRRGLESRMHMKLESEANLLGAVFTDAGAMTGAPYRVVEGDHWIFAGTGLRTGDVFGEKCLHQRCPGGASGHETDKRSASSPANARLLARGMNPNDGGAEMVVFDTPSGGAVFSVGSINYVASLPVDEAVSRITENALRKMLG